ncbi:hypothetical protein EG68_11441 [Paragonimus skrjabini miyazakii]|uniref:Uncharacterized protein n=1 Tax=Paragonimus skrjabini miyazakii TaxID=59628 RepID=A0A8S9Y9N4_9TREM|nr:hypothetical protein EG68_11441 [Paragonimus skrjabini miyazakii]
MHSPDPAHMKVFENSYCYFADLLSLTR